MDTLLDMDEQEDRFTDPAYRAAVIDLLGTLAYGELSAFLRLASDAERVIELYRTAQKG